MRIGRRADPTPRKVGRVGGDDVEGRSLQRKGREAFVQLHPRLFDVPFDLIASRIFRQHAAKHGQAAAIALHGRREGRDRQSRIALRTEDAALVLQSRRIDGDDDMRRVDAEIGQQVLIEDRPQKPIAVVELGEELLGRLCASRGPAEAWRAGARALAQDRVLQNDCRRPAREADIIDADIDQERVG